ncbi:MAG: hypothetical protein V1681_07210 [Candidatus Neomarinimicrobiota bacterium]
MKSLGVLIVAVSLVLLVLEHLKLIDVFGIVGLLTGLFAVMFPDKAEELVAKLKSGKLK